MAHIEWNMHWLFLTNWDQISRKPVMLACFVPRFAAVMTVAGKEGVEVKGGGKLKWPWKRPLPGPLVGFQRALIMSWRGHWLQGGHIFNTKQTPERVCLLTNEQACSDSLYVWTIFVQLWRMHDPYECGVHMCTWIAEFILIQNIGIWLVQHFALPLSNPKLNFSHILPHSAPSAPNPSLITHT